MARLTSRQCPRQHIIVVVVVVDVARTRYDNGRAEGRNPVLIYRYGLAILTGNRWPPPRAGRQDRGRAMTTRRPKGKIGGG